MFLIFKSDIFVAPYFTGKKIELQLSQTRTMITQLLMWSANKSEGPKPIEKKKAKNNCTNCANHLFQDLKYQSSTQTNSSIIIKKKNPPPLQTPVCCCWHHPPRRWRARRRTEAAARRLRCHQWPLHSRHTPGLEAWAGEWSGDESSLQRAQAR